jgi:hypothetical protein
VKGQLEQLVRLHFVQHFFKNARGFETYVFSLLWVAAPSIASSDGSTIFSSSGKYKQQSKSFEAKDYITSQSFERTTHIYTKDDRFDIFARIPELNIC